MSSISKKGPKHSQLSIHVPIFSLQDRNRSVLKHFVLFGILDILQTTAFCLVWQMVDKVLKTNNPKYLIIVLQFQNHNKILNIKSTDDQQENSDMRMHESICLLHL